MCLKLVKVHYTNVSMQPIHQIKCYGYRTYETLNPNPQQLNLRRCGNMSTRISASGPNVSELAWYHTPVMKACTALTLSLVDPGDRHSD